jgi:hypothetical protein
MSQGDMASGSKQQGCSAALNKQMARSNKPLQNVLVSTTLDHHDHLQQDLLPSTAAISAAIELQADGHVQPRHEAPQHPRTLAAFPPASIAVQPTAPDVPVGVGKRS